MLQAGTALGELLGNEWKLEPYGDFDGHAADLSNRINEINNNCTTQAVTSLKGQFAAASNNVHVAGNGRIYAADNVPEQTIQEPQVKPDMGLSMT